MFRGQPVDRRRALLRRHFGEEPPPTCGNCDNCLDPPRLNDATELARKLLSAVYRTGQTYGFGHVEKVLTGKADERIAQRGHEALSVFGIVGAEEVPLLRPLARALQARGVLVATEHGGLALGDGAREILRGEEVVGVSLAPRAARQPRRARGAQGQAGGANPVGDPLFEALRGWRRTTAAEAGVPPYVVFHDATLREVAARRPANIDALGEISGMGARKLGEWGEAVLALVRQY